MDKNSKVASKSVFYNLIYWGVKLRAGFVALVLVLATVFIYQYWQDLSRFPLSSIATFETDLSVITLNAPEKITSNDDGMVAEMALVTNPSDTEASDTDNVIIEFSSDNPNINFEPKQIVLSKLELVKKDSLFNIKITSKFNLQGETVLLTVFIKDPDNSKVTFSKPILVESSTKNPLVFLSALLSFLTAIFSFIFQIRNFFSK